MSRDELLNRLRRRRRRNLSRTRIFLRKVNKSSFFPFFFLDTETEAGKNRDDDVTSTTTTTTTTTEFTLKTDQTDDNLLLTKTGYKVSDQLSKLSLNFCQNKNKIIVLSITKNLGEGRRGGEKGEERKGGNKIFLFKEKNCDFFQ